VLPKSGHNLNEANSEFLTFSRRLFCDCNGTIARDLPGSISRDEEFGCGVNWLNLFALSFQRGTNILSRRNMAVMFPPHIHACYAWLDIAQTHDVAKAMEWVHRNDMWRASSGRRPSLRTGASRPSREGSLNNGG
jgi:hypothetical protein